MGSRLFFLTFHPHGHGRSAVVASGALRGHHVAGGGLESVPAAAHVAVANGRFATAQGQMVVEGALGLVGDNAVGTRIARVHEDFRLSRRGASAGGGGCGGCGGGLGVEQRVVLAGAGRRRLEVVGSGDRRRGLQPVVTEAAR